MFSIGDDERNVLNSVDCLMSLQSRLEHDSIYSNSSSRLWRSENSKNQRIHCKGASNFAFWLGNLSVSINFQLENPESGHSELPLSQILPQSLSPSQNQSKEKYRCMRWLDWIDSTKSNLEDKIDFRIWIWAIGRLEPIRCNTSLW